MKVLAYTSPARGHLFPVIPILDELARRGNAVAVRTLASQVSLVRERGLAAERISPSIEAIEHDDYLARSPQGKIKRAMAVFAARAEHELNDLRGAITAEQPDAVLVDCMSWGANAVAESWGGPWAQWFPYPMPLGSADVPPFGPGLRPAAGPLGRLRDRALRPLLEGSVAKATLPGLNAVRGDVGLPPLAEYKDMFAGPPLVLYLTAEPFEYPRSDWPSSVRMVGPCCWDPPANPPSWLADLNKPVVLVSTSSEFQDDGRLVRTALEALAEEDVEVVATVPSAKLGNASVPSNARLMEFVPHAPILAHAACAVTHGGAGATQKALASAVPVCVVPFGRDQLEVARRVEVADAGTRLPVHRLTPDRLRAKVRDAMRKRAGAHRVADGFTAAGGPPAAADAFEAMATGRDQREKAPWAPAAI